MERLGTVAIVGVGLIGGSIGRALRSRGLAERIVGIGRDQARLAEAVRSGTIDAGIMDLGRGVNEADVVVVCTPVARIAADVCSAAELGPPGMLVTDAGSTKRMIVDTVEEHPRARAMFVGGHPIAGSERKGFEHADHNLFEGRTCVLTPTNQTPSDRLERARDFWTRLGSCVIETTPEKHDEVLALTSHLPHVVASALAATVPAEMLTMAAGAYRDGTRVAGADAELWTAVFRANRAPLARAILTFQSRLAEFSSALMLDDEAAIRRWWETGKVQRGEFDARSQPLREVESRPREID